MWGAGSKTFACVGFWVFMWVAGGVPSLMWVGRSLMWASGCSPGRLGGPGARVWAALVWSMRRHRQRVCVRVSGMWSIGRSCGPLTLMWSVSSGHVVYACSCGRSPSLRWSMSLAHVGPACTFDRSGGPCPSLMWPMHEMSVAYVGHRRPCGPCMKRPSLMWASVVMWSKSLAQVVHVPRSCGPGMHFRSLRWSMSLARKTILARRGRRG